MPKVPLLPNRSRYNLVTSQPSWLFHSLSVGTLTGVRPTTAAESDATLVDPSTVIGGFAEFGDLNAGGLFYHMAKIKRTVLVKDVNLTGVGVVTSMQLVRFDTPATVTRDVQALMEAVPFVPFKIAPNEMLKIVSAGTKVGVFVCIDDGTGQVF